MFKTAVDFIQYGDLDENENRVEATTTGKLKLK